MRTSMLSSLLALMLLAPSAVQAQHGLRIASVEALEPIHGCRASAAVVDDPLWSSLLEVVTLDGRVAKDSLRSLQDAAMSAAAEHPDDVDREFMVAAILGARAEVEGGRTKIRVAEALLGRLEIVLRLQPDHAGALHLLGRLNASVMRLDGVTRFLATRVMGGDRLGSASWNAAERLFLQAILHEPCLTDHRLQLARAYADQGKRVEARAQLRELFALGPDASRDHRVWPAAVELAQDLGGAD